MGGKTLNNFILYCRFWLQVKAIGIKIIILKVKFIEIKYVVGKRYCRRETI